jgi:hypothetical protein
MGRACDSTVQAARRTYALRITRTVCKSFVCRAIAFNIRAIIGRCISINVHGPIARRKSSSRAESPFTLCNSRKRSFADTARLTSIGPNSSAALFPEAAYA